MMIQEELTVQVRMFSSGDMGPRPYHFTNYVHC